MYMFDTPCRKMLNMTFLFLLTNYNALNNEFQTISLFWQRDLRWPQLLQYTSTLIPDETKI